MFLFVGLGNPGGKYMGTRHNIGRAALLVAQKKFDLPPFESSPKLLGLVSEGKIGKKRVMLLLPETFMNKSGNSVGPALKALKIKPKELVILHDDVDMLLGRTKLSFGRNSGGHKGVESVMRAIKTKDFWRMRLGVQKKRRVPGEDLVLQKMRGDEEVLAKKVIAKALKAIEEIISESPERAMNHFNG